MASLARKKGDARAFAEELSTMLNKIKDPSDISPLVKYKTKTEEGQQIKDYIIQKNKNAQKLEKQITDLGSFALSQADFTNPEILLEKKAKVEKFERILIGALAAEKILRANNPFFLPNDEPRESDEVYKQITDSFQKAIAEYKQEYSEYVDYLISNNSFVKPLFEHDPKLFEKLSTEEFKSKSEELVAKSQTYDLATAKFAKATLELMQEIQSNFDKAKEKMNNALNQAGTLAG
ncbi:MAG: hypothetical protein OXU45_05090 [Candidatus Melainabacteria bacterium]|nr:hypothetical protein [Candidatus Melainabacteria bacterium]